MRERAEYRLQYPLLGQPRVRLWAEPDEFGGRVLDLSESGARIELEAVSPWQVDDRIRGRIWLAQGRVAEFRARVLRRQVRELALLFEPASRIAIPVMFEEQRVVHARFPEWR
jgi:hypothetical protein